MANHLAVIRQMFDTVKKYKNLKYAIADSEHPIHKLEQPFCSEAKLLTDCFTSKTTNKNDLQTIKELIPGTYRLLQTQDCSNKLCRTAVSILNCRKKMKESKKIALAYAEEAKKKLITLNGLSLYELTQDGYNECMKLKQDIQSLIAEGFLNEKTEKQLQEVFSVYDSHMTNLLCPLFLASVQMIRVIPTFQTNDRTFNLAKIMAFKAKILSFRDFLYPVISAHFCNQTVDNKKLEVFPLYFLELLVLYNFLSTICNMIDSHSYSEIREAIHLQRRMPNPSNDLASEKMHLCKSFHDTTLLADKAGFIDINLYKKIVQFLHAAETDFQEFPPSSELIDTDFSLFQAQPGVSLGTFNADSLPDYLKPYSYPLQACAKIWRGDLPPETNDTTIDEVRNNVTDKWPLILVKQLSLLKEMQQSRFHPNMKCPLSKNWISQVARITEFNNKQEPKFSFFEARSIIEYLKKNNTSPTSKEFLCLNDVTLIPGLDALIRAYKMILNIESK